MTERWRILQQKTTAGCQFFSRALHHGALLGQPRARAARLMDSTLARHSAWSLGLLKCWSHQWRRAWARVNLRRPAYIR